MIQCENFRSAMAPLMTLSRDHFIETSLLKHTKEECGASPTLEKEAILLGEKPRPHPSQNIQRSLNLWSPQSRLMLSPLDPLSKLMLLVPFLLPPLHPNPAAILSGRQRNPRKRLGPA